MPECPYPPLLLLDLSQSENNHIKRQFKAGFYLAFKNVFKIAKQVIKDSESDARMSLQIERTEVHFHIHKQMF